IRLSALLISRLLLDTKRRQPLRRASARSRAPRPPNSGVASCDPQLLIDRFNAGPKVVELDAVVESMGLDHFAVAHVEEPGIGVGIGFVVARYALGVEKDDHRVAIGVDVANYGT